MNTYSKRQSDCLVAVYEFHLQNGRYPSVRILGVKLGLSSSQSTAFLLSNLQRKNLLLKNKNRPHPIMLSDLGEKIASELYKKSAKVKQGSLFDVFDIKPITLFGETKYTVDFSNDSIFGIDRAPLLLDTDFTSNFGVEIEQFSNYCLALNLDITSSSKNEYLQKHNVIPSNIRIIPDIYSPNDSICIYPEWNQKIFMVWKSESFGLSYRNNSTSTSISIFENINLVYNTNSIQLSLPLFCQVNSNYFKKKFVKALNIISQFIPFPIHGAILTKSEKLYVCSSHTVRKRGDFSIFINAVENNYYIMSGGDKTLIRDLDFNSIPVISIKNNNGTALGEK